MPRIKAVVFEPRLDPPNEYNQQNEYKHLASMECMHRRPRLTRLCIHTIAILMEYLLTYLLPANNKIGQ